MNRKSLMLTVVAALLTGPALATDDPHKDAAGEHRHRAISEQAIAACAGKTEGEVVSVTSKRGHQLKATCTLRDGQLFAKPERKSRAHIWHGERMKAALAACAGQSVGAQVALSGRDGSTLAATCELIARPIETKKP